MALAIGIVITGITVVVFRQAAGVYSLANAKLDAMMGTRTALDIIEKDLQGAFLDPSGNLFLAAGPTTTPTATSPLLLYATPMAAYDTSVPPAVPAPGARIYYFLQGNSLVRYDFPGNTLPSGDFLDPAAFDAKALVYGVRTFTVQYYNPLLLPASPWTNQWVSNDATNFPGQYRRLPSAVRIVMETVDSRGYLLRSDQTPFRVSRIFEVGTQAPGQ